MRGIIEWNNTDWTGPEVRLGAPSGVVTSSVVWDEMSQTMTSTSLFRTARVLLGGRVAVRIE
ncbi:hypothetical protein ACPUD8_19510 [Brevibacterium sp. FAM 25378]|uniref:hypothetical protein n=1 Tax=unclassified Brevibacterium TaxID=2614124 RepID=UPI001F0DFAAC|nr:hypothetical protein [Brevibacterium sp. S22]